MKEIKLKLICIFILSVFLYSSYSVLIKANAYRTNKVSNHNIYLIKKEINKKLNTKCHQFEEMIRYNQSKTYGEVNINKVDYKGNVTQNKINEKLTLKEINLESKKYHLYFKALVISMNNHKNCAGILL